LNLVLGCHSKRRQSFKANSRSRAKTLDARYLRTPDGSFSSGVFTRPDAEAADADAEEVDDITAVMDLQLELLQMHQQTSSMLEALSRRLETLQVKPKRGRNRSQRS